MNIAAIDTKGLLQILPEKYHSDLLQLLQSHPAAIQIAGKVAQAKLAELQRNES